jgi:hypothetical protein
MFRVDLTVGRLNKDNKKLMAQQLSEHYLSAPAANSAPRRVVCSARAYLKLTKAELRSERDLNGLICAATCRVASPSGKEHGRERTDCEYHRRFGCNCFGIREAATCELMFLEV